MFNIKQEYEHIFGDIVICIDQKSDGYWRHDVYPLYKSGRSKDRDESEIDFDEVFAEINELVAQLKKNIPWKVIEISRAEADDIMLVLAREFNNDEKILIHSPDKDMIQAQRDTNNVFQYSSLTKKWIVPENKHVDMSDWLLEHVCLGDACDGVPRIIDHTEFSLNFLKHLENKGYKIKDPVEFNDWNVPKEEKIAIIEDFNVYKTNRKGESTGVLDVYKDIRFGATNLRKKINEHGSLDAWLDSHPFYRPHYERNFKLVMEEGIPHDIRTNIILYYKEADISYNLIAFEEYLIKNNLKSLVIELPSIFKLNRELCAEDFDW